MPAFLLPPHLGTHGRHPLTYSCPHSVLVFYSIDSDIKLLIFMAGYAYNVYFSIIVLKVGLKLLRILRHQINYALYKKTTIGIFILYESLLIGALVFSILER
jgi:hypothetical protein